MSFFSTVVTLVWRGGGGGSGGDTPPPPTVHGHSNTTRGGVGGYKTKGSSDPQCPFSRHHRDPQHKRGLPLAALHTSRLGQKACELPHRVRGA